MQEMDMIEKIREILAGEKIEEYRINAVRTESAELFFVKRRLDMSRKKDVTEYVVTIYRRFAVDGQEETLAQVTAQLFPGMPDEEIAAVLREAYENAEYAQNKAYMPYAGRKEGFCPGKSALASMDVADTALLMADALFAAEEGDVSWINSAEIFAERTWEHIVSPSGTDVSFSTDCVKGEYVVQCKCGEDVELYRDFAFDEPAADELTRQAKEALKTVKDRSAAKGKLEGGEYTVVLSGKHVATLLDFYAGKAMAEMIYPGYSDYEPEKAVQGEEIVGEKLNLNLIADRPYSSEGIPMKDRVLLQDGVLKTIYGSNRFCSYLGVEPTGNYRKLSLEAGTRSLSELLKAPCLYVVDFSDFQADEFTGFFGGEIRLAYLYDGDSVRVVTGGSINGNINRSQENYRFSREKYKSLRYEGPFAVRLEHVAVAGN